MHGAGAWGEGAVVNECGRFGEWSNVGLGRGRWRYDDRVVAWWGGRGRLGGTSWVLGRLPGEEGACRVCRCCICLRTCCDLWEHTRDHGVEG